MQCGEHGKIVSPTGSSTKRSITIISGYIGGIKERSAKSILEGKFPERIVEKAVERMLRAGPWARSSSATFVSQRSGTPDAAQSPTALDVAKLIPRTAGALKTMAEIFFARRLAGSAAAPAPRKPPSCAEA